MRKYCDCGRKIVVFKSRGRKGVRQAKDDHDLCQRCWKSMKWIVPEVRRITPR